jgi:prepilin-type processing-associated H-X9-DG protein
MSPNAVLLSFWFVVPAVAQESRLAPAAGWPQWRGPNRDAVCIETGLLQEWPEGGPPLLWKHTGLGGGYSTPAITGGKIYGMSYRGNNEVVWCLDETTQNELWAHKIANKGRVGYNEGSRCTPTIDGNRLYAVGVSGDVVCLNIADGSEVWKKNFGSDFGGRMMSSWGFSESPLIDGDKCIVTPGAEDAALVALNKADGSTIWKAEVPEAGGAGYASVMPADVGGVRMYVTLLGRKLVGVAADDGKLLWEYKRIANRTANIPTVVVKDDTIFCSTAYQTGSAVLKLEKTADGVSAREIKFLGSRDLQNHHGGMVLVGNHVYLGHGHNNGAPACVEFSTGTIAWKQDRGAGGGSAAVLYADGHVIFRWQEGTVGLIEANPNEYKLKGSFRQPDRSRAPAWSHPVIVNGKLYLRDQDLLLCYDLMKK